MEPSIHTVAHESQSVPALRRTPSMQPVTPRAPQFAEVGEGRQAELTEAKVMLVDDEALTLEVISTFLEEAGYSRFIATTEPEQAMRLLAQEQPDVLLLDLIMPKVSGFDILAKLKADQELRYTPVIVLTSATDPDTKLKALEFGATDFLAKPVDPSELRLRMRNTLAFKVYQNRLANYDAVTGLPNRRLFTKEVERALHLAQRHGHKSALLQVNLDRFKQINETLGNAAGDALLREVAQRIDKGTRDEDAAARLAAQDAAGVSRIGGDEFAVLLERIDKVDGASVVARRLLEVLAQPYHVAGQEVVVTASVGIALCPDDANEPEELLQHASAAVNYAKQQSRNSYQFFSRDINARAHERLSLENQLRRALDRDEFVLHFQPKVDIATGQIKGAEALIRWNHPELGFVAPARFIPLAEETGLIVPIGEWVLQSACAASARWATQGLGELCVAVNVSGAQFRQPGFHRVLQNVPRFSNGAPRVALELTEGTVMDDAEQSVRALRAIKDLGLQLAIDDFGTGYSSLSYLKRFPLDELKIDRSFVNDVATDAGDAAIVSTIISLANSLGLRVVAEGVETSAQLAFLQQKRCDQYQGYLFSRPLPSEAFSALLSKARQTAAET
jgi:diguanylate cyclase